MNGPKGALLQAKRILLIRSENGWLVKNEQFTEVLNSGTQPLFVFESTASLAKHLLPMLGETKWTVQGLETARSADGKFTKKTE